MKLFYLTLLIFIVFSCKKTETEPEISQLWIKVGIEIPDFTVSFKSLNHKSAFTYVVTYTNNEFCPNLKSGNVMENGNTETWVLVHNSYNQTDEIVFRFSDSKVLRTRGFKFGEKRFIEVVFDQSGVVSIEDRDISTINEIIWID